MVYRKPAKRQSSDGDAVGLSVSTAGGKKAKQIDGQNMRTDNEDKRSSCSKDSDSKASAKKCVNSNLLSFDEEDV
jgi:hypothetical protein